MRESCFGSGTQGKQDCYEYHQGRTEVNMRQKKRDGIWGYIFIAPQVIGLLLFSIIPIICVFYFSFCKWDAISEPVFVGIQNYITEFHDPAFYKAIVNTLKYSLIYIPGNVVFIMGLPDSIMEAGKIDGCSYPGIFFKLTLPLIKPALSSLFIFSFLQNWNSFLYPMLFLNSQEKFTLPLMLNTFKGLYFTDWPVLMAACSIVILPVVLVYLSAQKYIIEGIAMTGIKG